MGMANQLELNSIYGGGADDRRNAQYIRAEDLDLVDSVDFWPAEYGSDPFFIECGSYL